jgi:hypothetical protein
LGNLAEGSFLKEDFQILPIQNENTVQTLKVVVSYLPGALRSRFEKSIVKDLVVAESGVVLDAVPPTAVFAGQSFTNEIQYTNSSDSLIKDVQLHVIYPSGFNFVSSEPITASGNNTWNIGDLEAGQTGVIKLVGNLTGQAGALFEFRLDMSADLGSGNYTIAEKAVNISIASSPLALWIDIDGDANRIASPGMTMTYNLSYQNNTEIGLKDVIVTAKIVGEMFDFANFKSDGSIRSADNTVV